MNRLILCAGMVLSVVSALPGSASACLWDYDTLKQERARFPDTLEIIAGKFLRHSKEFYEWRVQDRLRRIAAEPKNAALYDDLAVAYEKTGQNPKAIETMLKVEAFAPGRYETYSNLGAFYFLGGDLKKGLEYVDKALAINPDAHFGREKYQKYLTEYVIEASKGGKIVLPLSIEFSSRPGSFGHFLAKKISSKDGLSKADYQAAVKGVLGMMRFANYDSPILLEAIGDLLVCEGSPSVDAKRLATRAFLQAAYRADDPDAKAAYQELAHSSLAMQTKHENTSEQLQIGDLEREFQAELADAMRWYNELRAREIGWIRDGLNPEVEFDKLYTEEPRVPGEIAKDDTYPSGPSLMRSHLAIVIGIAGVALLLVIIMVRVSCRLYRASQSRRQDGNP